jgi:hypothetical protein
LNCHAATWIIQLIISPQTYQLCLYINIYLNENSNNTVPFVIRQAEWIIDYTIGCCMRRILLTLYNDAISTSSALRLFHLIWNISRILH